MSIQVELTNVYKCIIDDLFYACESDLGNLNNELDHYDALPDKNQVG